ncbi:MAG: RdgB/HAM1 family non-canonical purine NTP pyrophosphatase [Ilumatobacteraceae bacterium]|nr:RdgB/HAM1 family non-canonical purine NTP pyrophosphatase [Ilumatobacteraceae bacterium]
MKQLVCASANPDKVAEIADLLRGVVVLLPRPDSVGDIVEDADSLLGNARLKARAIATATGMPAVADDTGLEVDALDGAPGVHTARFAGDNATYADNRAKLLSVLCDVAPAQRTARFRTVALVAYPDGSEQWAAGVCEGAIALVERGERGFGYDAVFVPNEGTDRTFAEMSVEEKHSVGHRGRAFRALALLLA